MRLALVSLAIVAVCCLAPVAANIIVTYPREVSGTVLKAIPEYYGPPPVMTFGNFSGEVVLYNSSKLVDSLTVLLCPTYTKPVEAQLEICAAQGPGAIVAVTPLSGSDEDDLYPGRTMYIVGVSYFQISKQLQRTPIVEVPLSVWKTLVGYSYMVNPVHVIVDGSTINEWMRMNESGWGIWYQVSTSLSAFVAAIYSAYVLYKVHKWENENNRGAVTLHPWDLRRCILVGNIVLGSARGLFCAFDEPALRRLIPDRHSFFITMCFLYALIAMVNYIAAFLFQTVKGLGGTKLGAVLIDRRVRIIYVVFSAILVIYLIMLEVIDEIPIANNSISFALSKYGVVIIITILVGLSAAFYGFVIVILWSEFRKRGQLTSLQRSRLINMCILDIGLWLLLIVTVVVMTPAWNYPWTAAIFQWFCYFPIHPGIQFAMVTPFSLSLIKSNSSRGSGSSKTGGKLGTAAHSRTGSALDVESGKSQQHTTAAAVADSTASSSDSDEDDNSSLSK